MRSRDGTGTQGLSSSKAHVQTTVLYSPSSLETCSESKQGRKNCVLIAVMSLSRSPRQASCSGKRGPMATHAPFIWGSHLEDKFLDLERGLTNAQDVLTLDSSLEVTQTEQSHWLVAFPVFIIVFPKSVCSIPSSPNALRERVSWLTALNKWGALYPLEIICS